MDSLPKKIRNLKKNFKIMFLILNQNFMTMFLILTQKSSKGDGKLPSIQNQKRKMDISKMSNVAKVKKRGMMNRDRRGT